MQNARRRENLKKFLKPRHIVYVGGEAVRAGLGYVRQLGFDGSLWAVHPRRTEIDGVPCFPSAADLPEAPDAAFIAIEAGRTVEVVRDLAARGAAGAVCYAAGFSEVGGTGVELEKQLVAAAGEMAIIGPNCTGAINYFDRASLARGHYGVRTPARGIALIAQSGTVPLNVIASNRGLDIGYSVNVGNQAITAMGDLADAILDDPRVSAIGLFVEGFKDVAMIESVALRALERALPIVVLKSGVSAKGAEAARSHTGAMVAPNDIFDAFLARLGIVRVASLPEFIETLKLFSSLDALPDGKLAVLTYSGADAGMAADLAERHGIDLPRLSERRAEAVGRELTSHTSPNNPLDLGHALWGQKERQTACYEAMMGDEFDTAMLIANFPYGLDQFELDRWFSAADALIETREKTNKTFIYAANLPEGLPDDLRSHLTQGGIAGLQGLEDAFAAFAHVVAYKRRRGEILDRGAGPTRRLLRPAERGGPLDYLDEWQSKAWLRSINVNVPRGICVPLPEIESEVGALNFPVVIKAVCEQLTHKTEAGAVRLDLHSPEEVIAAAREMHTEIPAAPNSFIVEEMVTDGVAELIVGLERDPQFGMILMLGSGGIHTELLADKTQLLLPADADEIRTAIKQTKAGKLIDGFRGKPAGDLNAAVEMVDRIARAAVAENGRIAELDVNPLIVRPRGRGAVAVDALLGVQR